MTLQVSCERCGKEFSTYPAYVKRRVHHFCSPGCASAYLRDSTSVERPCVSCGKTVRVPQSLAKKQRTFCSTDCRDAARRSSVHGTCACYNQQRCRCDACKQANTVRQRVYQARKRLTRREGGKTA